MSAIFISYRRGGALIHARALFERLSREFGPDDVFIDLEGIEYGVDFVEVLSRQLQGCRVMLALIDPQWATAKDKHGRVRLEVENDFVRTEIVTALNRGIRTVPVLIDGAEMPEPESLPAALRLLAQRQAVNLDFNRFDAEIERLAVAIRKILAGQVLPEAAPFAVDGPQRAPAAQSHINPSAAHSEAAEIFVAQPLLGTGRIFISYSHTDLPAAKMLCSELEGLGAKVHWLDKSRPRPREKWEEHLTAGLNRCHLFLPLVSSNTEANIHGLVHAEWTAAVEGDREFILGRRAVVPVLVDPDLHGDADRFRMIPKQFRGLKFGQAPGGRVNKELRELLIAALRDVGRRRSA